MNVKFSNHRINKRGCYKLLKMKPATKNLEQDHKQILHLIEIMERMTKTEKVVIQDCESSVEIIRDYADGLHHAKEEKLLFPLLSKKGFPVHGGPVGVMLMEHEQGRDYVRRMIENINKYNSGEMEAMTAVLSNMLGYGELLRNHIYKENNIII
ncbi:MAG: hemerythrin [Bacteroidetes bacterium]|nr:hemerythrin [Bacteroidota bacterium]